MQVFLGKMEKKDLILVVGFYFYTYLASKILGMKKILFVFLIAGIIGCDEKSQNVQQEGYVPELIITDSLVIDRLTTPFMADVKSDHSEFLFYDWKTSEFLRISPEGDILQTANLTGDGKNSMQAGYFIAARYGAQNEIIVHTITGTYFYEPDFNLIRKVENDFELVTRTVGGSRSFDTFEGVLYTFSMEEKDRPDLINAENYSIQYPFTTLRDINTLKPFKTEFIPKESSLAQNPGYYTLLDPYVQFQNGELLMIFPNSPELYIYEFPSLNLKDIWELDPENNFKLTQPTYPSDPAGFIKSFGGDEYSGFVFSNGYLLTKYKEALPSDELQKITPENISSEATGEILGKYRSNFNYQIFKEGDMLWEGKWDVNLSINRDLIFASYKPGEDPNASEKDVQTFYFYELR
jgi:hypothetical protein